ncbi:TPA_asm: hypothetical protein G0D50_24740 [Salmonella enterica subsp. enterica serovar Dublin]|nr:hypothetical protein [Salmonella enterica subsp. enterica serovar Dublin]
MAVMVGVVVIPMAEMAVMGGMVDTMVMVAIIVHPMEGQVMGMEIIAGITMEIHHLHMVKHLMGGEVIRAADINKVGVF